jgi:hypothetical protein
MLVVGFLKYLLLRPFADCYKDFELLLTQLYLYPLDSCRSPSKLRVRQVVLEGRSDL